MFINFGSPLFYINSSTIKPYVETSQVALKHKAAPFNSAGAKTNR